MKETLWIIGNKIDYHEVRCIKIICNLIMDFPFKEKNLKKNEKKKNIKKTSHKKLLSAITLHNSSKPNWVSIQLGL